MNYVRTDISNMIGTITMCRDKKMNALNDLLIDEIIASFSSVQNQQEVRVIILRAQKGAKIWSAGRDIKSLPTEARDIEGWDTKLLALGNAIRNCPLPVIAMIEGNVWGLACEMAFSCDIILATPKASFAITPAKLGVPYTLSGLQTVIERLGPNLAKEMLFCATGFDAKRLCSHGIINHIVAPDKIEKFAQNMALNITSLAPLSIAALKQQITDISKASSVSKHAASSSKKRAAHLLSSADYKEGISAIKQKRRPNFQGK